MDKFWERLLTIDRRVIFVVIFLALSVPIFLQIGLPIPVTREVQVLYDSLEDLPRDSKILVSCDFDPGSEPELQPMAEAAFKYFVENDLRFIVIGLWPQGPIQGNRAIEDIDESDDEYIVKDGDTLYFGADLVVVGNDTAWYGIDFINLGFQVGQELVIQRMGTSFEATFPSDRRFGRPQKEFPIMDGIYRLADFDFVFNLSAGYPGTVEWVQFAVDRFHVPVGAANTAVQAPLAYPYLDTGQLSGILGGMKGGAEFEKLVGHQARATMFMTSQTMAHIFVMLFIIVGNIAFFATMKKSDRRGIRE
ncbi:MAG: hypothetical protein JSU85_05400 [Candidatus Zixiibacteriota bacterium]|nr:MAG: hypothetical protein JSU85_05400 [candidate division Zixibacteria bacterium]